ncbi:MULTISPECIES: Y-family DNA polymerase [unclassified Pseudoalteromonas]|uniref:Y-family DNA polymerase n=1 Tax=unclassified Pseudoalteromonas TaxID=194690 RepID=UPI0016021E07|nr:MULTISPECIES: Y-family DNA polymerase [unclassified Pseudoalteromonas]MBB1295465.1 Y-family DNA polymerase [Pseudoalteromonas sp. SR41-4]MBB1410251.1 Y-family DNA polymerase [Pseudoalteromonas sp. SG44-17]
MWVLCDINAAYVSFIQLFNPQYDINTTPLGVLSSNQGNVIARNQPMKALGVKMGEPHFRIKELIQNSNGHVWGSNFTLFGDMSNRFHTELEELLFDCHRYSIDESFGRIDTAMAPNPKSYALHIKNTLAKNLGIGVGVGVAHTKTLAKLASHAAKLNAWKAKTNSVAVLDTPEKVDWVLKRVKASDIWGVGSKTAGKLTLLGVNTGLELKNFNVVEAKQKFGVVLSRTIQELNGINAVQLKDLNEGRDSICVSRSMGKLVTDLNELKSALSSHVSTGAGKLRRFELFTNSMTIFVSTDVFRLSQPQLRKSIEVKLPFHCADSDVLIRYAMFALEKIYQEGYQFKKVGVIFNQLLSKNDNIQLNLFNDSGDFTVNKMTTVSDEINSKFGNNVIRFGVQGFKQSWKPRDDLAPNSYTTNFNELPVALAK